MIKTFCDVCHTELQEAELEPQQERGGDMTGASGQAVPVQFRVQRSINGCWNAGAICLACLRKHIANLL